MGSVGVSISVVVLRGLAAPSLILLAGAASATSLKDLPKGAHPGDCFSRRSTPAVYRTDHIAIPQPPVESWRDIPAIYKTVSRQVLVTPARVDHETLPAVMGRRVHFIDHQGPDRIVEAPPVYRWIEKRVLVAPARLVWKPGVAANGYDTGYGAPVSVRPTGEVMCRVLAPARYEVRRVRVLIAPGRTCVVKGPTTRQRVVESYVIRPARTVDHPVAAVYRTVTERVLVRAARKERVVTPQPPRYLDKRVLVSPARTGWTRIACAPPPRVRPMGYGSGPEAQPRYNGQNFRPDYAPPRPGALEGAPQPAPHYHAPPANSGGPER